MIVRGGDTAGDERSHLRPDQIPTAPASGPVTAGHGPDGDVLGLVLSKLDGVTARAGYWMARCPAHEDRRPSLKVGRGDRQPVVMTCHAGCDTRDVLAAVGLDWSHVCAVNGGEPRAVVVAEYPYTDEAGAVLYAKERREPKDFRLKRPDGRGGWRPGLGDVRRVLYRLPRVAGAIEAGRPVWVVEGESDVHAMERAGAVATTNHEGAAKPRQRSKLRREYAAMLAGADVTVVADDDRAGRAHARAWRRLLVGQARSVRLVLPAEGCKDAREHLAAGHGLDGFRPLPAADTHASIPSAAHAHLHTPPPLARDQDILARMVCTLRVCRGLVGEARTAKLAYLAVTSRLLPRQVNIVVKGLSSSGKSYTVECVIGLFPDDPAGCQAVYVMTAMSERALIYLSEPLAHRTVVLYEAAALREGREKAEDNMTAYLVRSLLSEGRIVYPVVVRGDDGELRTKTITKEGPTNLVTTTTSISLHRENETRMLSLPSDDSAAQTRAVLLAPDDDDSDGGHDAALAEWRSYQCWLAGATTRSPSLTPGAWPRRSPRLRYGCAATGTPSAP
jgi:hypothetical protein